MATNNGWAAAGESLGNLLTGAGREDAFQAGRYRSAQTEQALSAARKAQEDALKASTQRGLVERVAASDTASLLGDELMGAIIAGGMGGDFSSYGTGRLRNQEYDFRARAADPTANALERTRVLGALSGDPYSDIQALGSHGVVDLTSDAPAVQTTALSDSLIDRNRAQTAASYAASRASDALATQRQAAPAGPKAPAGQRYVTAPDGTVYLEDIPGGPTDPVAVAERKMMEDLITQYPRTRQRYESSAAKTDLVIDQLEQAIGNISPFSAGFVGQLTSKFGGTAARDLRALLDPVIANIGFSELGQMRQESPTGGALGQVAVRELEMLQAVLGSLDQAQSPQQLARGVQQVLTHYKNFREASKRGIEATERYISTRDPSGLRAAGVLPARPGSQQPEAPGAGGAAPPAGSGGEQVVEVPGVGRVTVRVRQ